MKHFKILEKDISVKMLWAVPDEKNMVFEGKALYFCGAGGGWLFFNPVMVVFSENVIL